MYNYNQEIIKNLQLINYDVKRINSFQNDSYLDKWMIENRLIDEEEIIGLYSLMFKLPVYENESERPILSSDYTLNEMKSKKVLVFNNVDTLVCLIDTPFNLYNVYDMLLNNNKFFCVYLVTSNKWEKFYIYEKIKLDDYSYDKVTIPIDSKIQYENDYLKENINIAPLVQKVNHWINKSIMLRASDIHFEPCNESAKIRIRIDGKLKLMDFIQVEIYEEVVSRIKILANLDITQKLKPQDGKISYSFENKKYDLRISVIPTVFGEKIVIRILDQNNFDHGFSFLSYSNEEEEKIKGLLKENNGLILVTGPTGCGKTTTLYTYLKELIDETTNIVTVEDPVEYSIDGINQIQTNQQIGLTFDTLLRSILRQDPNIIMIGEIRDEETAQIAMRSAISGHLVLSTLHANYAVGSITRLMNMGIPKYLVSSAIKAVVSQKLVRRLCPYCKKKVTLSIDELNKHSEYANSIIYEKGGCPNCFYTGYSGRLLLSEILILDDVIKELIMKGVSEREIQDYAIANGMITLKQKLKDAIADGIVSINESN